MECDMTRSTALDRDALYYPYIHIKDVNWLKATLLCFPGVRRMVPDDYVPNDPEEVQEFCELRGPRDSPLLTTVDPFSPGARRAEENLLIKLEANDQLVRSKYSKARTLEQYGKEADTRFRLHDEKIIERLYRYLTQGPEDDSLAWTTVAPKDRPQRHLGHWLALHPVLGSAILSVKAVSIANEMGLNIVTDSSEVHHDVVSKKEDEIFEYLIGQNSPTNYVPGPDDTVDDLAEIVITTNFDVSQLSPRQVADLLADGKDLRRFKDALVPFASSIPSIKNLEERRKRLKEVAGRVVREWETYRKSLPRFAVDAIFESSEVKWPDLANSLVLGAGAGTLSTMGAGVGLGVTLVSYAGLKIWRTYKERASSPYSYLSRIAKAQSKSQSFLVLPPIA
jgi:hypothetical protein